MCLHQRQRADKVRKISVFSHGKIWRRIPTPYTPAEDSMTAKAAKHHLPFFTCPHADIEDSAWLCNCRQETNAPSSAKRKSFTFLNWSHEKVRPLRNICLLRLRQMFRITKITQCKSNKIYVWQDLGVLPREKHMGTYLSGPCSKCGTCRVSRKGWLALTAVIPSEKASWIEENQSPCSHLCFAFTSIMFVFIVFFGG